MYSEKSSMRASHLPAAFCAFRPLLLVPFVALFLSIGNSRRFVKGNQKNKLTIPVIPYRIVVIACLYELPHFSCGCFFAQSPALCDSADSAACLLTQMIHGLLRCKAAPAILHHHLSFYEGVLYGIYQSRRDFRRTKKRK